MPVYRWLIAAALGVYSLSLLGLGILPSAPHAETPPREADDAVAAALWQRPQIVGMNLNYYHDDAARFRAAIDEIAATGFNAVQIVTPVFQRDGASQTIEILEGPGRGPTRADLLAVLRYAADQGLHVSLMPQINFTHPRGNEWRGKLRPAEWAPWWRSYEAMIGHFLDVAAEAGVDMFVVGCELLSTQRAAQVADWRRVIALARSRFPGTLTYSTNWDSYDRVLFWDQLDVIGINGYWDLTRGAADAAAPTDAELHARWRQIQARLLAFAQAQGRPILLTEVGYPSLPWALKDPWNYVAPRGRRDFPDGWAHQARGYAAFLEGWAHLLQPPGPNAGDSATESLIAGVLFYKWDIYGQGDTFDTGYGIAGKPAQALLHQWLTPHRPAAP